MVSGDDPESTDTNQSATPGENTAQTPIPGQSAEYDVRLERTDTDEVLFDGTDIKSVGSVQEFEVGGENTAGYVLPIALTEEGVAFVSETFRTVGVDENSDEFEMVQYLRGEGVELHERFSECLCERFPLHYAV